jgi:hypothetical protein
MDPDFTESLNRLDVDRGVAQAHHAFRATDLRSVGANGFENETALHEMGEKSDFAGAGHRQLTDHRRG